MRTLSQAIHAVAGSPPRPDCADRAQFICWVCGNPATRGMDRARWQGANFTGQNRVRCPESDFICEACVVVMAGRPPNTERLWTHLVEGASHVRVNKAQKPIMREFLRRAHLAPWGAAIADSGQKHICPWAPLNPPNQTGGVILFEEAIVDLPRDEHGWSLLHELREVLTDGATKEEIGRGEYGPRAWQLLGGRVRAFEDTWGHLRGGAWFDLALWLAQRDEERVQARMAAEKAAKEEERAAKRRPKGKAPNPDRRGSARSAGGVPRDAGRERAEALGASPESPPVQRADELDAGRVADGDAARASAPRPELGQLALFPRSDRRRP